jgi:hypothetical protein
LQVTNCTSPKARTAADDFTTWINTKVDVKGVMVSPLADTLFVKIEAASSNAYQVSELKGFAQNILDMCKIFKVYSTGLTGNDPYAKKAELKSAVKVYGFAG